MLLPALGKTKAVAGKINCMNQLKQIGLGAQLYSEDNDSWIVPAQTTPYTKADGSEATSCWFNLLVMHRPGVPGYGGLVHENYKTEKSSFRCPSEAIPHGNYSNNKFQYTHYGINGQLSGRYRMTAAAEGIYYRKTNQVASHSAAVYFADKVSKRASAVTQLQHPSFRHSGRVDPRSGVNTTPTESDLPRYDDLANFQYLDGHGDSRTYSDLLSWSKDSYNSDMSESDRVKFGFLRAGYRYESGVRVPTGSN